MDFSYYTFGDLKNVFAKGHHYLCNIFLIHK